MEDMALAMPDITDMLDTHTPMDTTERDLLMLSQRLMLIPISMDMVLDTEPTDMDTHMPMVPMDTMERDLLMLSQRLMLIPISCTEDMALAMPDITDMLDTLTPTDTTERDPLMLSQRLMLMLLSSMELMDTTERDLLMLSQRLMLMLPTSMEDTTDMPDLMPMDTEATDTHTGDKSYTPCKNSTKQKLKANNILL